MEVVAAILEKREARIAASWGGLKQLGKSVWTEKFAMHVSTWLHTSLSKVKDVAFFGGHWLPCTT